MEARDEKERYENANLSRELPESLEREIARFVLLAKSLEQNPGNEI